MNGNNDLVLLNAQTGAETEVGSTGIIVTSFGGMPGGPAYAVDLSNNLYQVNLTTGAATLIGPTGLPAPSMSFAFGNSLVGTGTTLYYTEESADPLAPEPSRLYTLNLSTGLATPVGLTGASIVVGSGIIDNTLYGFTGFNSQEIVLIDPATGASTPGASTPVIVFGAAGQSVPEPASATLLVIGAFAVVGCGSRIRRLASA